MITQRIFSTLITPTNFTLEYHSRMLRLKVSFRFWDARKVSFTYWANWSSVWHFTELWDNTSKLSCNGKRGRVVSRVRSRHRTWFRHLVHCSDLILISFSGKCFYKRAFLKRWLNLFIPQSSMYIRRKITGSFRIEGIMYAAYTTNVEKLQSLIYRAAYFKFMVQSFHCFQHSK